MKTSILATIAFLIYLAASSADLREEEAINHSEYSTEKNELYLLAKDVLAEDEPIIAEKTKQAKIIIMNSDFRNVRVGYVNSMEELNWQSTLVPVIYRANFITKIDHVSYYMLK
jgi:hypothetical protein